MVYFLASEDGPLGDFANTLGLENFRKWARSQNAPYIVRFLNDGWTDYLKEIRRELAFVRTSNKDIQDSLDVLRSASRKAKDILILSNGETDDAEDDIPEPWKGRNLNMGRK